MANVARFDPFQDSFEDIFRRLSPTLRGEPRLAPDDIKIDVEEEDNAYVVTAEIPGVKKEDISVEIDGNVVTLRAETKTEREKKKRGRVVRSERYYGALFRSFTLGTEVDASKAEAKYADGVLTLTLPKKTNGSAKRLTVN